MYYFGVKLHTLSYEKANKIPCSEHIVISKTSENDLTIFKENWAEIENKTFFDDKIYFGKPFFVALKTKKTLKCKHQLNLLKGNQNKKGSLIKHIMMCTQELFLKSESQSNLCSINCLIEKTDIQTASKVRSEKGLLLHIFGKIVASFLYLVF